MESCGERLNDVPKDNVYRCTIRVGMRRMRVSGRFLGIRLSTKNKITPFMILD